MMIKIKMKMMNFEDLLPQAHYLMFLFLSSSFFNLFLFLIYNALTRN